MSCAFSLGRSTAKVNLAIRPASDWAQYGYADFWASPLQTLASGAGDREDYAIVKYVVLRALGMAETDLRLMIVRDDKHQTEHAIVAVRDEQEWLILDNRTMFIVNAEDARYYNPLFVLEQKSGRGLLRPLPSIPLQIDNLAFPRHYCTGAYVISFGRQSVHEVVVVCRVVVKQAEVFDTSLVCHVNAAGPCGMTPVRACHDFFFREGRIVNREIGVARECDQLLVAFPRESFGVAEQCKCVPGILKTIAIGSVRMIELRCPQHDVVVRP